MRLGAIGPKQLLVAGKIVRPMAANSATALAAQRPPQMLKHAQPSGTGQIGEFRRP